MMPPTFTPPAFEVARRAHQFAMIGYGGLAAAAAFFAYNSVWQDPLLTGAGVAILALGVIPMLRWLQRHDEAYPLVELMQFTLVPFYALPLLTAHEEVARYPEEILLQAAGVVLLFQVCCVLGAVFVDRNHQPHPPAAWLNDDLVAEDSLSFSAYTLLLTTVWLFISNFTHFIPGELFGTLRAVFFGIGTISAFIQARLWGAGQLKQGMKVLFAANIFLQFVLLNLSLVLVTAMILFLLLVVGYFSSARRLPLVLCLAVTAAFAVLHAGKHKMRDKYWGEYGQAVTLAAVPDYYSEWIGYGMAGAFQAAEDADAGTRHSNLLERASLFQLVCYVIDTVPDRTPFLAGETYSYVPPQVIPRFLWPNKPSPNDSVKTLSVKLGILSAEQAETTSIGYGLITEAYANFGLYGPPILGLLLGWALRKVARLTATCGTLSAGGILRILSLAWCLNAETTMAVWLSSFYQACIAILIPLAFYKSFFK
jgi:hypothetical protein